MNAIDFVPAHYRESQRGRRRVLRQAALLGLVTACMAAWHWSNNARLAELEMLASIAQDHARATESQLREMAVLETRRQTILRQTQLQRELSLPIGVTPAVATLAKLMPPGLAATRLSVSLPRPAPAPKLPSAKGKGHGPAVPAAKEPEPTLPMRLEITGLAPDDMAIADFVGRISAQPLFANVKMTYSRAAQAHGVRGREFRVEMEVPLDREYRPAKSAGEVAGAF